MKNKRTPPSSFRLLAVDVSNSFTKIALFSGADIRRKITLPTRDLKKEYLRRKIGAWNYDAAIISSVVPKVKTALKKFLGATPTHWVTHRSPLHVGIEYPKPSSIGADRLCNAEACAKIYGTPVIAVDFGTAVTFDVISAKGNYIGGVIAPGLRAMTDYLHERTALLPRVQLREPRAALGKTTIEAMRVGAIIGYRGLIRGILEELAAEQFKNRKPLLVATGGDAPLVASRMREFTAIDPHLTLRGLYFIAVSAFKQ
ncbi:MAG: type III pantothenate kinase [Chthoniobacterales bacterium]